uniref:Uncharacterized protein n=1 Tax=Nelumbo nucifera TaxID=4432 RepID=A0A822ZMP6_NELNU|nr:TPA_asm: hypothetical protein HUJ06_017231 [Nelumbo nucifera]
MVMSASLNTIASLMNFVMSQPDEMLSWPLFAHWLKTRILFVAMGFAMEMIQDRMIHMVHVFWKVGYKESSLLAAQAMDDLHKCLKVVEAYISKTEEKVVALLEEDACQQKVLFQLRDAKGEA